MKKRLMMAVVFLLCMGFACATGQTLPGVEVFSPGLIRLSDMLGRGERVEMTAQLSANDVAYARDVSVLQAMLSGAELAYEGGGTLESGADRLSIAREGETLFSAGMTRQAQGAEITIGDQAFGVDLSAFGGALAAGDRLAGTPILERVPLTAVCAWIEGLSAGSGLPAGFSVTQDFAAEKTMSDDGTRLTKINIAGEVSRAGDAPWKVTGFIRQPAGRAPKDTAEITFAQDEKNTLTLTYTATRRNTITKKDKAGEAGVEASLRLDGKIAGSGISLRLTLRLANAWTLEGENLREKVTVNATLGLTDRAPGRRMQRLNDASIKLRTVLTLDGSSADTLLIGEDASLSAVFDGNTFLDTAWKGAAQVGGAYEAAALTGAPDASWGDVAAEAKAAAVQMAAHLYAMLDDKAKDKIGAGL